MKNKTPDRPMFRLLRYLRDYRKTLWFALTSSVINKIFDLMPPILTAWFIDTAAKNPPEWIEYWTGLSELYPILVFLAGLTFFVFAAESLFEWLFKLAFMRLAQHVQHDLRMDAYNALQNRELAYFEEQRTGNLMSIINDDINQLERFLNGSFNEVVQVVTLFIVASWVLCAESLQLGLIGMIPIPFIIIGSIFYQRKVAPAYQRVRETVGELGTRLENNISGIPVIKSFTAEDYESERVRGVSMDYQEANFRAINWRAAFSPLIRLFIAVGFAVCLLIGAYWVLYEPSKFTLGGLSLFAMMLQRLLWPITRLGPLFDELERAKASARRVFKLLDTPNQIQNPAQAMTLPAQVGQLELINVHFEYKPNQPIINGINLSINKGETIGIAGSTGAGKTTLIKLFLRLYDVTKGAILLENINLKNLNIKDLRQHIGLVSQDVYLFHGTIYENIAYGKLGATEAEIIAAAKKAKLHEFIQQLPEQYQTVVGERGIKLSGGQRQRLSIARAILKNAPILILDEATSAVDTETERAIQQNLTNLTKGKTAIIIAHRLSTIRHANEIIVLENGQIAEHGTHDALLKKHGIYADLWSVQTGELEG